MTPYIGPRKCACCDKPAKYVTRHGYYYCLLHSFLGVNNESENRLHV